MSTATPARRESACPVHFLWEGRGAGRTLVRLGFLGFTLLGAVWPMLHLLHLRSVQSTVFVGALPVAAVYLVGQLLSLQDRLRPR